MHLAAILLNGYALQKIARGSVIVKYLKTITPLLHDHHCSQVNMQEMGNVPEMGKECDVELKGIQPAVMQHDSMLMSLWKSYKDWLRLMVVHFDAVDILNSYITGPHFNHDTISIKILMPPPVGGAMLPWQVLLKDSNHFPTKCVLSAHSALDMLDVSPPTNDDILKFLETAISSDPQHARNSTKTIVKAIAKLKPDNNQATYEQAINKVELLGKSRLPGWQEHTAKIILNLKTMKTTVSSLKYVALVHNITCAFLRLQDNAKFFLNLRDMEIFMGMLHCKACLTSLLALFDRVDRKYEDILEELKVCYAVVSVFVRL
jgi:hypothetical protein